MTTSPFRLVTTYVLIQYNFLLPPKDSPCGEPGGYFSVAHYVTDALLAVRQRGPILDSETITTQCDEVHSRGTCGLNTKPKIDNMNTVSSADGDSSARHSPANGAWRQVLESGKRVAIVARCGDCSNRTTNMNYVFGT